MSTQPRDGKRKPVVLLCITLGAILAPSACTQRTDVNLGAQPPATGTFVSPDAEAPEASAGLIQYCPSDECPTGYTTCPLSNFRCDVNLLTDRNNCGACGVVCPKMDFNMGGAFECVDGRCELQCAEKFGDCDGVVDNGCESGLDTNDNCRVCGNKCADDQPCSDQTGGLAAGVPTGKSIVCRTLFQDVSTPRPMMPIAVYVAMFAILVRSRTIRTGDVSGVSAGVSSVCLSGGAVMVTRAMGAKRL